MREYEVLAEHAVLSMRIDSVVNPPWGVAGGMQGGTGRAIVNPGTAKELVLAPLSDGTVLRRGDVLLLETGGGGGHGHPFDRPAVRVLEDIADGFVSVEAARRDYGVLVRRGGCGRGCYRGFAGGEAGGEGVPSRGLCRCYWVSWIWGLGLGCRTLTRLASLRDLSHFVGEVYVYIGCDSLLPQVSLI